MEMDKMTTQNEVQLDVIDIICRFLKCEKFNFRAPKFGRYYLLYYVVTGSNCDEIPVGTVVVRIIWGNSENLRDKPSIKSPQKLTKGLVSTMQDFNCELHSPEQLRSERWHIVVEAAVREATGIASGSADWEIAYFGRTIEAWQLDSSGSGPDSGTNDNSGERGAQPY